jgi:GAF domain-containing protein
LSAGTQPLALLVAPIFDETAPAGAPLVGVLQCMRSGRGDGAGFSGRDVLTIRLLATQASVAIINARRFDTEYRREVQACNCFELFLACMLLVDPRLRGEAVTDRR